MDALARRHRAALVRYFQRKGFTALDAEDGVQEVFERLARRDGLADRVEHFDGYLFAVAAHVATDLLRRGRARRSRLHDSYEEAVHAPRDCSPEEVLEGREALARLVTALKELPERTRHIFILARLEHMRQAEIARRLGVSLSTVEKHLASAIAYLGQKAGRS
ncbi:MAG TPA: sigma-70 family RNA polymerase sigma factor [Phenylobacterium sp.]|uniref:RNA polymerase sigma factor n=1 Tax=Phenylobacterium sp. TaxID=1871053 RepID=UPI002B49A860|nr:sigma-70 family RNA polymerase sigma factor [Phenylobacterium sp.]HKR88876.1 sigma-70 family RNA polymerase sigma factor [Phenylobacterium sp.]